METLASRLEALLAAKSLLNHPFYRAWTAGTLEVDHLREYARQYYHFEAAFPRMLSAIHTRTESAATRQAVLTNLWDEEYGDRNHLALWLEFAAALGLSREELVSSTPNAETAGLIAFLQGACRTAPVAEALATLYAYEGQVPAVANQKIAGLRDRYGLSPEQYEFFSAHAVADIAHSEAELAAIVRESHDDDAVVAAAEGACEQLLSFLDGCYGKVLV